MTSDPQAERELYVTALLQPGSYTDAAAAGLKPEHLTIPGSASIWAFFGDCMERRGREPNGLEVREHFERNPTEMEFLNDCYALRETLWLPLSVVGWSASRLVNLAQQRQLSALCHESTKILSGDTADALEMAMGTLAKFKPIDGEQRIADHEDAFEQTCEPPQTGMWGIGTLDLQVPLCAGRLVYVAARTSVGKSALGLTAARHTAMSGKGVLLISVEMTHQQMSHRVFCMEAATYHPAASTHRVEWERTKQLDVNLTMLVGRRLSDLRNAVVGRNLGLIVVDYVQRMEPSRSIERRHEQIEAVSGELQEMAKRCDTPVLALAQLSRKADERDGEPRLSDLRDSGALEQDADAVIGMWRKGDLLTARVMKNRHGPVNALVNLSMDHFLVSERFGSEWSEA